MRITTTLGLALALGFPGAAFAKKKNNKAGKKKAENAIFAGEMPQANAHTLRKGQGQIDLFTRSHWGLTNDLQLDVTMGRFLFIGPNAGLEYAFLQDKKQAVSLTAYGQSNWRRYSQYATLMTMYTYGGHRSNRATVGLGVDVRRFDWDRFPDDRADQLNVAGNTGMDRTVGVPVHLGYDLVKDNKNVYQFWVNSDLAAPVRDDPFKVQAGASWNHGWDTFRMSLGLTLNYNALADLQEALDSVAEVIPSADRQLPRFVPLPYVRLWWRF